MLQEGKADSGGTQKEKHKHMQVALSEGRKERKERKLYVKKEKRHVN